MKFSSITFWLAATCLVGAAAAQAPGLPGESNLIAPLPSGSVASPGLAKRNPFTGSVLSGRATAEILRLSLSDAIDRGLKYNLGLLLDEQESRLAEGERIITRSAMLPHLNAYVSESGQQLSLKAFGFSSFPGIAPIVGPFNLFDARASVSQSIWNLSARHSDRAAMESAKAAQYSYSNARDAVVLAVAGFYLQALAGAVRIEAVEAQLATAEALHNQAADMKQAGVIPAIDVIRAQVERQAQQQRLIFFQNEYDKEKLNLARAIGLPLDQKIELTDRLAFAPPPSMTFEDALAQAYQFRADYQNAQTLVRAAEAAKRAAATENLPSLSLDANYGDIGPRIYDSHGTFSVAGTLHIGVFQGGRRRGDVMQADALLRQRTSESEDLRGRIDYEVRSAFLDLKSTGDRVDVARSAQDLAGQQVVQSRDRFAAGVTNNVEVVQAQEARAAADENYISSLFSYNLAKVSLARAIGIAEKSVGQFLGGTR